MNNERWVGAAVSPVLRLWMWVSELMATAGLFHRELQGGCALGVGHRGVIVGNPPLLWLRKGVPEWRLSLCQGGGQAWAHRPSWYLSATWQALSMSCYCWVPPSQFVKGNSVTMSGRDTLRPWERPSSVVAAYTVVCTYAAHISSPLSPDLDLDRYRLSPNKNVMKTSKTPSKHIG